MLARTEEGNFLKPKAVPKTNGVTLRNLKPSARQPAAKLPPVRPPSMTRLPAARPPPLTRQPVAKPPPLTRQPQPKHPIEPRRPATHARAASWNRPVAPKCRPPATRPSSSTRPVSSQPSFSQPLKSRLPVAKRPVTQLSASVPGRFLKRETASKMTDTETVDTETWSRPSPVKSPRLVVPLLGRVENLRPVVPTVTFRRTFEEVAMWTGRARGIVASPSTHRSILDSSPSAATVSDYGGPSPNDREEELLTINRRSQPDVTPSPPPPPVDIKPPISSTPVPSQPVQVLRCPSSRRGSIDSVIVRNETETRNLASWLSSMNPSPLSIAETPGDTHKQTPASDLRISIHTPPLSILGVRNISRPSIASNMPLAPKRKPIARRVLMSGVLADNPALIESAVTELGDDLDAHMPLTRRLRQYFTACLGETTIEPSSVPPVWLAAKIASPGALSKLLELGARKNVTDTLRRNVLHCVFLPRPDECLKLVKTPILPCVIPEYETLPESSAPLSLRTPRMTSVGTCGQMKAACNLLLARDATPHESDLRCMARVVELLCLHGTDLEARDCLGKSPANYAQEWISAAADIYAVGSASNDTVLLTQIRAIRAAALTVLSFEDRLRLRLLMPLAGVCVSRPLMPLPDLKLMSTPCTAKGKTGSRRSRYNLKRLVQQVNQNSGNPALLGIWEYLGAKFN